MKTARIQLPYVNQFDFKYEQSRSAPSNRIIKTKNSTYALHQSVLDGRLKQLGYFLQMGLDVNAKDKYGRACLILACLSDHEEYGIQVAKLLLRYHADVNIQDGLGRTPVFLACTENREKLFNLFLDSHDAFIDYRIKDNDGNALINHVAINGNVYIMRKLIDKMIQRKIDIDQKNNLGYTALLLSIKNDKYLNAYYLIKDGQASISTKDNEQNLNAIEWLFSRINSNKEKILNNELESSSSLNLAPIRITSKPNYKTWYATTNQYYLKNPCEHVTSANLSIEHHKSRYIPIILKNKTLNLDNLKPSNSKIDFYKKNKSVDSLSDKSSFSELSEDLDEGLGVKEVIQKLYELIFRRMSHSQKMSQNLVEKSLEFEKFKPVRRQSLTTRQRSHSIKPIDLKALEEIKEKSEKVNTKNEQKLDTNIFDLEELRYTPKLIALSAREKNVKTAKEIVHKMFDLYDSSSGSSLQISNYHNNHLRNHYTKKNRKMSVAEQQDLPKILIKSKKVHSNSVGVVNSKK